MEFYYWSIFSLIPLSIAYVVLAVLFSVIVGVSKILKRQRAITLAVVGVVFLILPFSEELWIAWNFAQACKGAGTFIKKTVEVEGFYDAMMHSGYELTRAGVYKFVEQKLENGKEYERVEKADANLRFEALAWNAKANPDWAISRNKSIYYPLSDDVKIVVFPNGVDAWKVTRLDRPTARYWFQRGGGERFAHGVGEQHSTVTDTQSGEIIANYISYFRQAPWFFVSAAKPTLACDGPGARSASGDFLIYRSVLQSAAK